MKRTSLMLDERLLAEATQILAAESYSATVNTALKELVRLRKIQTLPRFFGWEGDLSQMREDRPPRGRRRK